MASHANILLHITFGTKDRTNSLFKKLRVPLFKYIIGISKKEGFKIISINGIEDHIHLLISIKAHQSASAIVQKIKSNSSRWIHENYAELRRFAWQEGFGVFSVSESNKQTVIAYIENQEIHHKRISFREEYELFLEKHNLIVP